MSNEQKLNIFDRVTRKIITDLEHGIRPWQKPWSSSHAAGRIVRPLRHTGDPTQIGTHDWRLRIERTGRSLVTKYEFRSEGDNFWQYQCEWGKYDINDTYLGLPKGLAKLYERERSALIKFGLVQERMNTKQLTLSL